MKIILHLMKKVVKQKCFEVDTVMYINHPIRIEEVKKEVLEGFGDGIAVINPDTMNIDIKNDKFEKYREEYRQRKFKSINKDK